MKIRPLNDRLIIRQGKGSDVTKGGIIIPDAAKQKPLEGVVIAVGNGKLLDDGSFRPLGVKEGETVLFTAYAGTEVKHEGEDFLMIREEDVLAVLD